jgi:hypothetical protein
METMRSIQFFSVVALFFSAAMLGSCKKETHENVHENLIVGGVRSPYSGAVSTLQLQTYINKLYVDLLSREPTNTELTSGVQLLKASNGASNSRHTYVTLLLQQQEFYSQFFLRTSGNLLNATSKKDMDDQIQLFNYLYNFYISSSDPISANSILIENSRLKLLYAADSLYQLGQLSINDFYGRFINNYFFDEINMGTENYVKAVFENLFHRTPSVNELYQSSNMVDGLVNGVLFGESGASKGDFVQIVTHSNSFYEGLITSAYLNFLLRKPTDTELAALMPVISGGTNDYKLVIQELLCSKEYAGF